MRILPAVLLIGMTCLGSVACDRGEEQAKLEEEKREAAEKSREAQREADEAKAKAASEVAEAQRKADEARVEARAEIQKDVADLDRKAASLKENAAKAAGAAKLNAEAAAGEFDKRRALVEADLQRMNTATGEAWETVKTETKQHVDAAEAALDNFDRTLTAKR